MLTATVLQSLVWTFLASALAAFSASSEDPTHALVNGMWFDGVAFEQGSRYVARGGFTSERPAHIDRELDLGGRLVIPPFGEAHMHLPYSAGSADRDSARFLTADVF